MNLLEKYDIPKNAIFTVAGTVGVGKSTLTNSLSKALGFKTSFENVQNNPYLDKYYKDFLAWGFHLQIFFLAERFKEQKRMFHEGGGFVQDRSIYEDTGIFARMLKDQGNMTDEDFNTYSSLFEAMVLTPYFPAPNALIYIDGDLEDVLERIKKRGRKMEQETDVAYWKDLYNRYDTWINNFNHCPVVKININEYDLKNNPESIEVVVAKIAQAIHTK